MKKRLLVITILVLSCLLTGCAGLGHTIKYGSENLTSNNYKYFVTRIPNEDLPDEWHSCANMSYYYHIDTNIIYFGTCSLDGNGAMLVELKSRDFRNYVYDTRTKEFIGIK